LRACRPKRQHFVSLSKTSWFSFRLGHVEPPANLVVKNPLSAGFRSVRRFQARPTLFQSAKHKEWR
jgi:hypothetical protein